MYFEEIPCYTIFDEVQRSVANAILSASDTAEFLGDESYGLGDINELYGTRYEDIVPAFLSCRQGESDGGMRGNHFRFQLTAPLKKHILDESLTCMFGDGRTVFLENLSLFKGEKCLFSCVSHEAFSLYHMAYADDSLKDSILSAADSTIKDLPLYGQMQKIASELKVKPEVELKKEMRILLDLCWYVDGEKKYVFRMVPEYECDFQTFKKIAKTWLTEGTSSVLLPLCSFADLQPLPVPETAEDILRCTGKAVPQYQESEYYIRVRREVTMLKYLLEKQSERADP